MSLSPQQELELLRLRKKKSMINTVQSQESTEDSEVPLLDDAGDAPTTSKPNPSSLAFGTQAVGRGIADVIGFPVDLATMGINAGSSLLNKIPGVNIPQIEKPILGSDSIADSFGNVADKAGYPLTDPEDLGFKDKIKYNVNRFATGAGMGGMGAAMRATKASDIAQDVTNLTRGQRLEKALVNPYLKNPGRQVIDDTIAGAGAGAGYTAGESLFPDSPIAQLLSTIVGGGATSVGSRGIENTGRAAGRKIASTANSTTGIPVGDMSRFTTLPDNSIESRQTVDDASSLFKMIASNPEAASANIKSMNQMADENNMTRLTSGVAADDVGLGAAEVRLRTQNPRIYQEKDQKIRTEISKQMNDLADPEADVTVPQGIARQEIDRQVGDSVLKADQAHKKVAGEKQNLAGIDRETEDMVESVTSQRGKNFEASKLLDKQIGTEGALGERTKLKNQKFEDSAGDQVADVTPLARSLKKVEDEINELGFENSGIPADFVKKIRAALPKDQKLTAKELEDQLTQTNLEDLNKIESAERKSKKIRPLDEEYTLFKNTFEQAKNDGALSDLAKAKNRDPDKYANKMAENLELRKQELDKLKAPDEDSVDDSPTKSKEVKLKDVARVRRDISSAISRAKRAGNFDLADNLSTLKGDINKYVDGLPEFEDAQKYYREEYAPFFAEGYGKKYRDTVQRADERTGIADPGRIADLFLNGTPDAVRDLKKIVEIAPDKIAANSAVRNYMAADLATKIGDKASPRVIANWIKNRSAQLDEFPEIKKEFQDMQRKVGGQEQKKDNLQLLITQLSNEASRAERDVSVTRNRVERGVLGTIANKDPDRYVKSIMSSDDRLQQLDEVNNLVGNNQEAKRGFKRAVVDYILKETEGSNIKLTDNKQGPIQYGYIKNLMDENEDALAKVLSPQEMNTIRRAQKWIGQYGNLSRRSTTGADTAEKMGAISQGVGRESLMTMAETAFRVKYGVLKAGGIMRTIKGAAALLPDSRAAKADKLIAKAMLDPELAAHLLDAPVKDVDSVKWNKRLTQLLGVGAAARESSDKNESEDEE